MSVRDYDKIVTVTNGITNEVRQFNWSTRGMGFFNLNIRDYLLLVEIKECIDNEIPCSINFGYKKH